MKILCLNFQHPIEPSFAEAFLSLSPRVQFRFPHSIFVDVESTMGLLGGRFQTLKKGLELARALGGPEASAAIANTPYHAQVLARFRPTEILDLQSDARAFHSLSLDALPEFEGLTPWGKPREIENLIEFFRSVGLKTFGDLMSFPLLSFRERWGELGISLWKKLHLQEEQVISPLIARDPLTGYAYLDQPAHHVFEILQNLNPILRNLFLRLEGLQRHARQMHLTLFCEYSDVQHRMQIEPVSPSRDLRLFQDLLLQKLESTFQKDSFQDGVNPVREFEVHIEDAPEKVQQLDLFEKQDQSEDRWKRLLSFAKQAEISMGFFQIQSGHFPEENFVLKKDLPERLVEEDVIDESEQAVRVKAVYAKEILRSPRPNLILSQPQELSSFEVGRMQFLSRLPIERISHPWWKMNQQQDRDYFFAFSQRGELLWVFQDRASQRFFLHGHFD